MKVIIFCFFTLFSFCIYPQGEARYIKSSVNGIDKWVLTGESKHKKIHTPQKNNIYDFKNFSVDKILMDTSEEEWERVYPQPTDGDIFDIVCKDSFALFTAPVSHKYNSMEIYRSFDNGSNWEEITPPESAVFFDLAMKGDIIYGAGIEAASWGGIFYVSTDLGYTWEIKLLHEYMFITNIFLFDNDVILLVGASYNSYRIFKSIDGGNNWTSTTFTLPYSSPMLDISFTDNQNGWLQVTNNSINSLMKTTNGGISWTTFYVSSSEWIEKFLMLDQNTGFVIEYALHGNEIKKTTDGGLSWILKYICPGYAQVSSASALDNDHLYIMSDHIIYKSSDRGENWSFINTGTVNSGLRIKYENQQKAWLFGYYGTLRLSEDGGFTFTDKYESLPDDFPMDISFINENTGWITGYYGSLMKSSDAGDSWEIIYDEQATFGGIYFTGESDGYLLSGEIGYPINKIRKTTDGGYTWNSTFFESTNLMKILFLNPSLGWSVGMKSGTYPIIPYIINTTNEGLSWYRQENINLSSSTNDFILYSCFFSDTNNGWSVGADGVLLKTTDAGESWNTAWGNLDPNNFWINTYLYDVCFVDQNIGFITGTIADGMRITSLFLKTKNGGTTWDTLTGNFPYQNKIYFKDEMTGYLFGYESFKTTDGGSNWMHISPKAVTGISAFKDLIRTTGYGGNLYRNTGDPSSAAQNGVNLPGSFNLYQNYPNPFNPITIITFELNAPGKITIRIFDALGREIKTLIDEERSAGMHKVIYDSRGLASGVYYYALISGNKRETKKMVLLK